jgi:glycerol kinase
MKYIMSIDQGTTGSTVLILDQGGSLVSSADCDFKQIYPQPGWVEHDPVDIWKSVEMSALAALKKINATPADILTIGITNQRETVIAWRKSTSEILHNAIVWQCRRTASMCQKLKPQWQKKIQTKTGLVLDPYFSGSKMRWMIENIKSVRQAQKEKDLAFGTIDTYLLWKLTNGTSFCTDVSNASRTLLMNLKTLSWDPELLKLFKVSEESLPQIKPSAGNFGVVSGVSFASNATRVTGIAGDQQSALFGQACFAVGDSKCTFGTGSFILLNTGTKILRSRSKMLSTVAWQIHGQKPVYALEGGAFICGAAIQWLRDGLGLFEKSSDVEALAKSVADSNGVEFVPALTGLGAPHWNAQARGEITGLTRGVTKAHIARATLEAMALQNAEILLAMQKDLGHKIKSVKVDGGASQNNLLMQIQSDYLQTRVVRPKQIETTAMGAAYLAGLGAGVWKNISEIQKIWNQDQEFKPQLSSQKLRARFEKWNMAIQKTKITSK